MASLALASAELKVRPEASLPELSGPSAPSERSTPETLMVLGLRLPRKVPPPPEPPPPGNPPPLPPEELNDGIFPLILVSVRVRPPVTAATLCSREIVLTAVVPILPSDTLARLSTSIVVPPLPRARLPNAPRKPKLGREEAVGVLVTV